MKNMFLKMISLGLSICLLSAFLPVFADTPSENCERVEVWRRTDIILKSRKKYGNPYKDVELDAVFTHEDGTRISLYGFWNGGDEWRVRFAPSKTGLWTYEISCSDPDNPDLHGQKGKLLAVENTGTTALDRHGFVRISDNGRYFVYDDGTPFYWLGDTNWQAPNYVSLTRCNYPGCLCANQFRHELSDRIAKGFTVYQTYFDSAESDGGGQLATTPEPSMWIDKFDTVNPKTFTEKFDVMFDCLADSGMVIALGFGVHSNTTENMSGEDLNRISRYLTARYAAYPVIWITAQEITGSPQFDAWNASARIVDAGDGYHHPQGAHQFVLDAGDSYVAALDSQSWHEFYALQAGHGPSFASKSHYEGYWNNTRSGKVKPYIETEANYEDISCGGFNGYDASRIAAWKANLSGSYGFTYGVTGVWANNYSTAGNTGWLGTFSYEPWYMGIEKPGSFEMTYLKRFFLYADFSSLIPRFNDENYSDLTAENKVVASSEDGRTYAAYFYNSTLSTGTLRGLNPDESYRAKWYNPLTGRFVEISDEISVVNGEYTIPPKPTAGDWALLVTSRTDLGGYESETAYTDAYIDGRTNYAADGTASAGSSNGKEFAASAAIDGNLSTYWCAQGGSMPQWLMLDMGEIRTFSEIELYLHPGNEFRTESASFTLEGSVDGQTWETLYTADREKPALYKGKAFFRLAISGSFRRLRITFTEIKNNWAAVCELAVYDVPGGDSSVDGGNILSGASATASSFSASDSTALQAVDGDFSTWWCAEDGTFPQWVTFDMGEKRSFNRFSFTLYGGTAEVSYLLEGSDDSQNWTTVREGDREAAVPAGNSVRISGETEEVCSFRYLRITFREVTGNWATIVEAEAHLAAKDDVLPVYDGTLQAPGVASVGSYVYTAGGEGSDTASALFDSDPSTEWSPYAPIGSQTILMDLRESKELYGIQITLGKNAVLPGYRIEGSRDGKSWVILADATLRDAQSYRFDGRTVVSESLSGQYRYVKLLWLNAGGNSDVKTISGIELYAKGATPAEPKAPDVSALLALYSQVKGMNNSGKRYTGPSFRALMMAVADAAKLLENPKAAEQADVDRILSVLEAAYRNLTETDPAFRGPAGNLPDPPETGSSLTAAAGALAAGSMLAAAAGRRRRKKGGL